MSRHIRSSMMKLAAYAILCGTLVGSVSAQNLLRNPRFDHVGPIGSTTAFTGQGFAGPSAAADWTLYSILPGTISTELMPAGTLPWGRRAIAVRTDTALSGMVQTFLPTDAGPQHVIALAIVYVDRGQIGIGTGNDGATHPDDAVSQGTGRWQLLAAPNGVAPANEFVIYALSPGGADFAVTYAAVLDLTWDALRQMVLSCVTKPGIARSLCAKINAAMEADVRGDAKAKGNIIHALTNELAAQTGKSITVLDAQAIIAVATAL